MTACYTMIVLRLNANRSIGAGRASQKSDSRPSSVSSNGRRKRKGSSSKSSRNKTRVTIMCACMVVLFVICWLPFHGVHLAKMEGIPSKSVCELLVTVYCKYSRNLSGRRVTFATNCRKSCRWSRSRTPCSIRSFTTLLELDSWDALSEFLFCILSYEYRISSWWRVQNAYIAYLWSTCFTEIVQLLSLLTFNFM